MDLDIAIQEDDIFRRNRRLVCFDMDSTLIQTEVIDELAAAPASASRSPPSPRPPCAASWTSPRASAAAWRCWRAG
jgi:hypothetical protein